MKHGAPTSTPSQFPALHLLPTLTPAHPQQPYVPRAHVPSKAQIPSKKTHLILFQILPTETHSELQSSLRNGCPESFPRRLGSPKRYGPYEAKSVGQGFRDHQPSFLFSGICRPLPFQGNLGWREERQGGWGGGQECDIRFTDGLGDQFLGRNCMDR